jgi:hypothetical protein
MFNKIIKTYKNEGFSGFLIRLEIRLSRMFPNRAKCFAQHKNLFTGNGIEFGGKSTTFTEIGFWPVYKLASSLDNCNFGKTTIWEGDISSGNNFIFNPKKPPGRQYISDATDMSMIPSEKYDFLLSCHMLEHSANPILVLNEWIRLLRDEGVMTVILPHKYATFDHRRPVTTLEHMINDFNVTTTEDDLTHLPEILELHDLEMDPFLIDVTPDRRFQEFKKRSERNAENRILHHHVFDTKSAICLIDYVGLQILDVETVEINSILIIAQKLSTEKVDNSNFMNEAASYRRMSVFPTDRTDFVTQ